MSRFVQLHMLTSYPPANLNRDDLGRPKTAEMGGAQRLRVSSQCLKRTWRTSEVFEEHSLTEEMGLRTKTLGVELFERLVDEGIDEEDAAGWVDSIVDEFGDTESKRGKEAPEYLKHTQLVHYSPEELTEIEKLVDVLAEEEREPTSDELNLVQKRHRAADIAMFGRMMASEPKFNVEGAVQVAHALTVHDAHVEDDFFTAVDDRKDPFFDAVTDLNESGEVEDSGSAHMGQREFGAGLFYQYICIDRAKLIENLKGREELADRASRALAEAAATVAPEGMQNSYGSRARASYVLAERGDQQPRSLSVAFLDPISDREDNWLDTAIERVEETVDNMDNVYGDSADDRYRLNAHAGDGHIGTLLDFVADEEVQDA